MARQASRLAFAAILGVVTVIALTPAPHAPPRLLGLDKAEHLAAFAVLAIFARLSWPDVRAWGIGVALLLYGGMIELAQATPGLMRSPSLADLAADGAGIVLGLASVTMAARLASRYETAPR